MKVFSGNPASPGIAIGKVLIYPENGLPEVRKYKVGKAKLPAEWLRLEKAANTAAEEIKTLYKRSRGKEADIFKAHLMMLEDPYFLESLKETVYKNGANSEWAVLEVSKELSGKLESSQVELFQERAADIADVAQSLLNNLSGVNSAGDPLAAISEDVIIVADYLLPSKAALLEKPHIKGLVMDGGSWSCHSAIIARAHGVPAVMGLSAFLPPGFSQRSFSRPPFSKEAANGKTLVVDGGIGKVIIEPDAETLAQYERKLAEFRKHQEGIALSRQVFSKSNAKNLPVETKDGWRLTVKANIEQPGDAKRAMEAGAQGIGLYRTEFLFISGQSEPGMLEQDSEDAQFEAYTHVLKFTRALPVTIRTADFGGDKFLSGFKDSGVTVLGFQPPSEKNPLLGLRAIRLSLFNTEMFKTQLRAILRASVHGNLRIMFPMISGPEELSKALTLLNEAKEECAEKKHPFSREIEVGIMIEVPSAAVAADILAKKSHFFSIGTNDLFQYAFAADRENALVGHLCDPYSPTALRLLSMTIEGAHKHGIKAAMCGEMAGDPKAAPLLVGMGLDEFSMSAPFIPAVKQSICGFSFKDAKNLASQCLAAESSAEVRALVQNFTKGAL